jgi:hypothetical protein
MRQYAIDVGNSILNDRKFHSSANKGSDKVARVADQVVSVVVSDGEGIFSVIVKANP